MLYLAVGLKAIFSGNSFSNRAILAYLFLILYLFCALSLLGLSPIGDSSEAREGQVIWSILNSHEWILPLRNGIVPSKPPFAHWVGATIGEILGFASVFIVRIPAFLGAFGILILSAFITRRLATFTNSYSAAQVRQLSWLSVALLLCTYGFVRMQADARVDMLFSFWVVASIAVTVAALECPLGFAGKFEFNFTPSRTMLFYLCAGFAVLTKGPLGLVLSLLISSAILFVLIGIKPIQTLILRPFYGWIPFLAVTLPYYYVATVRSPIQTENLFLARQLWLENLERFSGSQKITTEPWWFYLPSFLRVAFPWSLLFFVQCYCKFFKTSAMPKLKLSSPHLIVGAAWFFSGLLFFSLSAGKRDLYLLPLLPGVVIALVPGLYNWGVGLKANILKRYLDSLICICMLLLFCVLTVPLFLEAKNELLGEILFSLKSKQFDLGLVLSFTIACALFSCFRPTNTRPLTTRVQCAFFSAALTLLFSVNIGFSVKRELRYFHQGAGAILSHVPTNAKLICIKPKMLEFFDPYFYYFQREIQVSTHLRQKHYRGYLLTRTRTFRRIRANKNKEMQSRIILRIRQFRKSVQSRARHEVILARIKLS